MKFSELWLREWVNPAIDSDALANQITMAGLEVDGVEPVAGSFHGAWSLVKWLSVRSIRTLTNCV